MILFLISAILISGYALLIASITIGWWRLKVFRKTGLLPSVKVSIIVAARNEAGNIESLLSCLLAQDYPPHLLEIIIVDDHSTDSTSRLVEEFIVRNKEAQNLKLITLSGNDNTGKKAAIDRGIKDSQGELIVITDADCTAGSRWISTIASYYADHKPQMILGPVRMTDKGSLFGKLQSLELISLISSAAGSCRAGFPILANGANMAFTRQAYESCGGFSGNMQFASGDDMFMMMSIKRKFGAEAIHFLRSEEAIVNTPVALRLKPFIQQRLRWVSKSRGYTDPMLIASSILVFLTNACLAFIGISAMVSHEYVQYFLLFYILKLFIDFTLMLSYSRFQRSVSLLWLFPIMELMNAVYTLVIGIAGNIVKYEWKGRQVSNKGMERG
jgi:cellulose synthase/poly-beta-1,6-N-acetylglucosamine synthase-like glycosyltransferase